ncbi:hypothetical protein HanIR_Chr13g0658691 [Helianthus annuus]|nr:hypothetical protein HanIR_Chr13g0658691 [Helianthus annuus]
MARLRLFGSVEVSNRTVEKIKSSLVNRFVYTYSVVVRINKVSSSSSVLLSAISATRLTSRRIIKTR